MIKAEFGLPFQIQSTIFCHVRRGQKLVQEKSHLGLKSTAYLMLLELAILRQDIALIT